MKAWMSSNFDQISSWTPELFAFDRQKKIMYNVVTTLATSFLIGSFSLLEVARTPLSLR